VGDSFSKKGRGYALGAYIVVSQKSRDFLGNKNSRKNNCVPRNHTGKKRWKRELSRGSLWE